MRTRFEHLPQIDVTRVAQDTWVVTLHRRSIVEKLVRMAVKKFGDLVSDTNYPNLKDLMGMSFTITGVEMIQAGDYDRMILTVELPDGKREQYGTFSDSIKQKVKRFIEPEILKGDSVAVKLIEVDTKKGRKAMTFTDADEEGT